MKKTEHPIAPRDPAIGGFQVLLHTGAFFLNEPDISVPSVAFATEWFRHYLSDADIAGGGVTGYGWDFSYNKRIVATATQQLANGLYLELASAHQAKFTYYDGQGRGEDYTERHSEVRQVKNFDEFFQAYVTTYNSPPGQFHEFERYILGKEETHPFGFHPNVEKGERIFYVLREKNGTRLVFNCRGQMIYILSRNDTLRHPVRVTLVYNGALSPLTYNPTLSEIHDTKGRTYVVKTVFIGTGTVFTNIKCQVVQGLLKTPRIKSIVGMGYEVTHFYRGNDTDPTLEKVGIKTGDVTREWRYKYDGGHHLLEVRDPNESAKGDQGQPYITNTWSGDRIASQTLGNMPMTFGWGGPITVTAADGSKKEYSLETKGPYQVVKSATIRPANSKYGGPWKTTYEHNDWTQVTKMTFPKGNGVSYEYESNDAPLTYGPFFDWYDRSLMYEHDLSEGNLLRVTHFSGTGGPTISASTTYDHMYNQTATSTDERGATAIHRYDFVNPGNRGNPIAIQQPSFQRPDGSVVVRDPETYTYNASGQRIAADLGGGRVTKYTFNDSTGYLERVEYPSRAYVSYKLSPRGEVERESGTDGDVAYKRDGRGLMTEKVVDPDSASVRTTWKYDLNGNPVETHTFVKDILSVSGGFDATSLGFQPGSEVDRKVTTNYDVLNRVSDETTEGGGLVRTEAYVYDRMGALTVKIAPGFSSPGSVFETHNAFDARGLLVESTEAFGTPEATTTKLTRDANGKETRVETSSGGITSVETRTYDGLDRLETSTSVLGAVTHYEHEPGGKITKIEVTGVRKAGGESAVLKRTTSAYDGYGDMVERKDDTLVNGEETTEWFYDKNRLVERVRGPNGWDTTFQHDLDNHVTHVVDPVGNDTVTDYNSRGQAWKITQHVTEEVLDSNTGKYRERKAEYETTKRFDALGNMASVDGPAVRQRFFYDSTGHVRGAWVDGEGLATYRYDGLGRRVQMTKGENFEKTQYTPAGLVSRTESPAADRSFEYDAMGRQTKITDNLTGAITSIRYDGLGREAARTDPNGTVITRDLESGGLREQVTVAAADVTVAVTNPWFPNGTKFPASGGTTWETYDYDALGRIVGARSAHSDVRMTWDGLDRASEEIQGLRTSRNFGQTIRRRFASDRSWREIDYPEITGKSTVRFEFDELGRVHDVQAGGDTIASYLYTGADRIAQTKLGNGALERFAWSTRMQVSQMDVAGTDPDGAVAQTYWRANTQYTGPHIQDLVEAWRISFPGAVRRTMKTHLDYDGDGRVISAETSTYLGTKTVDDDSDMTSTAFSAYANGRLKASAEYVRDGASRTIQNIRADTLTYDPVSRVASVTTTGSGAPDTRKPADTLADAQRLAADVSSSITKKQSMQHDRNGNLIYDGRFVYAWDFRNRLVAVYDTWEPYRYHEWVFFAYDPFDRRIYSEPDHSPIPGGGGALTWGGQKWDRHKEWYLYDGRRLIAEARMDDVANVPTPTLLARYYFGSRPGQRIRVDRRAETGTNGRLLTFYLHEDPEGIVKLLTTADGRPTSAANVEPPVGSGQRPERPPEDHVMIADTDVRLPYSADATRIDTFAGLVYREDTGAPALNYRAAHDWGRQVDDHILEDSIASLQNRNFTQALTIAALPLGAGAAAGYLGGQTMLAAALFGGGSTIGINAGMAWWNGRNYSLLSEGPRDFVLGAITGVMGGVVGKFATGYMNELFLNYALNTATETYMGAVVNGQSVRDAFAGGLVSSISSTAIGFGIGRVSEGLHWAGAKTAAKINAMTGEVRPSAGAARQQPMPSADVAYSKRPVDFTVRGSQNFLPGELLPLGRVGKAMMWQTIGHLAHGTKVSKELARRILAGTLKVRFSHFVQDGANAVYYPGSDVLHVNADAVRIDPRTGRSFKIAESPLMIASLIVHEGVHYLGGGELTAHAAQARFLSKRNVAFANQNKGRGIAIDQGDIPPLSEKTVELMDSWDYGGLVEIAEIMEHLNYGEHTGAANRVRGADFAAGDAWVKQEGGWSGALEINSLLLTELERKAQETGGKMW